jgi:hypothetical protein
MTPFVRSVLAVLGGYLIMSIVSSIFREILRSAAPTWSLDSDIDSFLAANFIYSCVAAMIGGFAAARIAPRAPMRHTLVLAGLVLVLAALYAFNGGDGAPVVYMAVSALATTLATIAGGWLSASLRMLLGGRAALESAAEDAKTCVFKAKK